MINLFYTFFLSLFIFLGNGTFSKADTVEGIKATREYLFSDPPLYQGLPDADDLFFIDYIERDDDYKKLIEKGKEYVLKKEEEEFKKLVMAEKAKADGIDLEIYHDLIKSYQNFEESLLKPKPPKTMSDMEARAIVLSRKPHLAMADQLRFDDPLRQSYQMELMHDMEAAKLIDGSIPQKQKLTDAEILKAFKEWWAKKSIEVKRRSKENTMRTLRRYLAGCNKCPPLVLIPEDQLQFNKKNGKTKILDGGKSSRPLTITDTKTMDYIKEGRDFPYLIDENGKKYFIDFNNQVKSLGNKFDWDYQLVVTFMSKDLASNISMDLNRSFLNKLEQAAAGVKGQETLKKYKNFLQNDPLNNSSFFRKSSLSPGGNFFESVMLHRLQVESKVKNKFVGKSFYNYAVRAREYIYWSQGERSPSYWAEREAKAVALKRPSFKKTIKKIKPVNSDDSLIGDLKWIGTSLSNLLSDPSNGDAPRPLWQNDEPNNKPMPSPTELYQTERSSDSGQISKTYTVGYLEDFEGEKATKLEMASGRPTLAVASSTFEPVLNGHVMVPRAEGSQMARIEVRNEQGAILLEGIDYEVVHNPVYGDYAIHLLNNDIQNIAFKAQFTQATPISANLEIPRASGKKLESLIEQLDNAGFKPLARELKKKSDYDLEELAKIFRKNARYTYGPAEELAYDDKNPFARFKKFLDDKGVMCAQCDGTNALFTTFLGNYFDDNPDILVEMRSSLSEGLIGSGIRADTFHARTYIYTRQSHGQFVHAKTLDVTPTKMGLKDTVKHFYYELRNLVKTLVTKAKNVVQNKSPMDAPVVEVRTPEKAIEEARIEKELKEQKRIEREIKAMEDKLTRLKKEEDAILQWRRDNYLAYFKNKPLPFGSDPLNSIPALAKTYQALLKGEISPKTAMEELSKALPAIKDIPENISLERSLEILDTQISEGRRLLNKVMNNKKEAKALKRNFSYYDNQTLVTALERLLTDLENERKSTTLAQIHSYHNDKKKLAAKSCDINHLIKASANEISNL